MKKTPPQAGSPGKKPAGAKPARKGVPGSKSAGGKTYGTKPHGTKPAGHGSKPHGAKPHGAKPVRKAVVARVAERNAAEVAADAAQLHDGVAALGLALPADAEARLIAYLDFLHTWNRFHNLVGTKDRGQYVTRHLLDCLVLSPHLAAGHWLDLGSGAGLPGLVLAIARPDQSWCLVDKSTKKAQFLTQAVLALQVTNARVHHGDLTKLPPEPPAVGVCCRAFGALAGIESVCRPLIRPGFQILAMKGRVTEEELAPLRAGAPPPTASPPTAPPPAAPPPAQIEVIPLVVPGLAEERHLIRLVY
jgi:16S rRNA (guanine527-N7)-methyltransferase